MAQIDEEIAAYEAIQARLEAEHLGDWVVIHNREVFGFFETSARRTLR